MAQQSSDPVVLYAQGHSRGPKATAAFAGAGADAGVCSMQGGGRLQARYTQQCHIHKDLWDKRRSTDRFGTTSTSINLLAPAACSMQGGGRLQARHTQQCHIHKDLWDTQCSTDRAGATHWLGKRNCTLFQSRVRKATFGHLLGQAHPLVPCRRVSQCNYGHKGASACSGAFARAQSNVTARVRLPAQRHPMQSWLQECICLFRGNYTGTKPHKVQEQISSWHCLPPIVLANLQLIACLPSLGQQWK
eukprot:1156355-Pelagomonas_calceolata.AAC.12